MPGKFQKQKPQREFHDGALGLIVACLKLSVGFFLSKYALGCNAVSCAFGIKG